MKIKNVSSETVNWLLSFYLEYMFKDELLLDISKKSFDAIKSELTSLLEDIELTDTDIKNVWKNWFDSAACNGTIVSISLNMPDHKEIDLMDYAAQLANDAIDAL